MISVKISMQAGLVFAMTASKLLASKCFMILKNNFKSHYESLQLLNMAHYQEQSHETKKNLQMEHRLQ